MTMMRCIFRVLHGWKFSALIVLPLAVSLCAGCSSAAQWKNDGSVHVLTGGKTEDGDFDAAWEGKLIERSGCLAIQGEGDEVAVAVFQDGAQGVTAEGSGGGRGVRLAGGEVLRVGDRHTGGGAHLEESGWESSYGGAAACTSALKTTTGILITSAKKAE